MSLELIESALQEARYETARRLANAALADNPDVSTRNAILRIQHEALLKLADEDGTAACLDAFQPQTNAESFWLHVTRAEDAAFFGRNGYRASKSEKSGLTWEEHEEIYYARAKEWATQATVIAATDEEKSQASKLTALLNLGAHTYGMREKKVEEPDFKPETAPLRGRLIFPDGTPVAGATVTLGAGDEPRNADPSNYLGGGMHYHPGRAKVHAITAVTDTSGNYQLDAPIGLQPFLAVTLDPDEYDIPTRFLHQGVRIEPGTENVRDAVVDEWQSAPPREVKNPFGESLTFEDKTYRRLHLETWKNPFHYDFERQVVKWPVAEGSSAKKLLLLCSAEPETPQPFQLGGDTLAFITSLPAQTDAVWALYETEGQAAPTPTTGSVLSLTPEDHQTALVQTGRADFRIAWGEGSGEPISPILAVRGEDETWRGHGHFILPDGESISGWRTRLLESGPIYLSWKAEYFLSSGHVLTYTFTAHAGEAYLLVHEVSAPIEGFAWEFSLRDLAGQDGRGYLHWNAEGSSIHWTDLPGEPRELARLQESVAWWIPPQGFGYAISADGLEQKDSVNVFTIRRGDWIDRDFAKLTRGPVNPDGSENRELDWPFPEMVGSTISMITAESREDGDVCFHFGAFDGERHWGLLVTTLERNDGPYREIGLVQHKNSSPRLQDFKDWHLDEADTLPRPHVVAQRENLRALRHKREAPEFADAWQHIEHGEGHGPEKGVAFAVSNDPLVAWAKKQELVGVAPIRCRMTLLGREHSDMYSPVGSRPITHWAEDYDLIAASGVFTPEEEREVRAFLLLMGHLYMTPDLMNWKYGSRNANFEADRVDVVGAIGLCFTGNPDAAEFVRHSIELMERSLEVYCTPGSGKWYENPACYYLHAAKCRCNLAYHLWSHGLYDVSQVPRFKEFLRWGLLLLTPPRPKAYAEMRDGLSDIEYRETEKIRVIAPVGDHAGLGRSAPEFYALMSLLYRSHDPQFADELIWAYQAGGSDGGAHGNRAMLFTSLSVKDLSSAQAPALASRRLEGFGAILRDHVGEDNEFYLLWKQGPGGYRYHRTEGSFILFADGKPLVYDGGEAGEAWRHSTLSFHDVHMPLAPGHVENFRSLGGVEWIQGVHPKLLAPGDPVFLSDNCHHSLVPEAWRRFNLQDPAAARSILRVADEYLILHDEFWPEGDVPTHWHIQVVADGETGDAKSGYRFNGRFGTDLQVLLPGQSFTGEKVIGLAPLEYPNVLEIVGEPFAMRHLQVDGGKEGYLALLRPLAGGRQPLEARAMREDGKLVGLRVTGDGIDDTILSAHKSCAWLDEDAAFRGRYGGILRRPDGFDLALWDGEGIECSGVRLESEGVTALLRVRGNTASLWTAGKGELKVMGWFGNFQLHTVDPEIEIQLER